MSEDIYSGVMAHQPPAATRFHPMHSNPPRQLFRVHSYK